MRRDSVKRLVVVLSEFLHFTFLEKEIYVHLILLSEEKINSRFFLNERLAFPRNSNARRVLTRDVRIKIIRQRETRCF